MCAARLVRVLKNDQSCGRESVAWEEGLELLDACVDDVAYAAVLLQEGNGGLDWRDCEHGISILHTLAYADKAKALDCLLQHGANPDMRNKSNETALHWCARMNSLNCATLLLQYRCDYNAVDSIRSTALHYAAEAGHVEIMPLILGAMSNAHDAESVTFADADGSSALDIALDHKSPPHYAIAVLLMRYYQQHRIQTPASTKIKLRTLLALDEANNDNPHKARAAALGGVGCKESETKSPRSPQPSNFATHHYEQHTSNSLVRSRPTTPRNDTRSPSPPPLAVKHIDVVPLTAGSGGLGENVTHFSSLASPVSPFHSPRALTPRSELPDRVVKRSVHSPSPLAAAAAAGSGAAADLNRIGKAGAGAGAGAGALAAAHVVASRSRPVSAFSSPARKVQQSAAKSRSPTPAAPKAVPRITKSASSDATNFVPFRPTSPNPSPQKQRYASARRSESTGRSRMSGTERAAQHAGFQGQQVPIAAAKSNADLSNAAGASECTKRYIYFVPHHSALLLSPTTTASSSAALLFPPIAATVPLPLLPGHCAGTASEAAAASSLVGPGSLHPPRSAYLDVVVAVEHCWDCDQHQQSLRHDTSKYVKAANSILFAVIREVAAAGLAVRLHALRCAPLRSDRIGALEVSIAVNIELPIRHADGTAKKAAVANKVHNKRPHQQQHHHQQQQHMKSNAGRSIHHSFLADSSGVHAPVGGSNSGVGKTLNAQAAAATRSAVSGGDAEGDHRKMPSLSIPSNINSANFFRAAAAQVAAAVGEGLLNNEEDHESVTPWATHHLFSKLNTRSWPSARAVAQNAVQFLRATLSGAHSSHERELAEEGLEEVADPATGAVVFRCKSPGADADETVQAKAGVGHYLLQQKTDGKAIRDVQKQYQEWVQRMKVPPRLERDPLDLAWPAELLQGARRPGADGGDEPRQRAAAAAAATGSGKGQRGTVATHPAGPMLDVSLAECLEIHDYERIALEHFRVFDCRIRD